jgi:hypothetical protein
MRAAELAVLACSSQALAQGRDILGGATRYLKLILHELAVDLLSVVPVVGQPGLHLGPCELESFRYLLNSVNSPVQGSDIVHRDAVRPDNRPAAED